MIDREGTSPSDGIVHKVSSKSVDETVSAFTDLVRERGLELFAIIDHSGEARRRGLLLRDTKVVIFGSPQAGTPVMEVTPIVALDLPLKVLVWDDEGVTTVSYLSPMALAGRYHLNEAFANTFTGIGPLTDAVTNT